MSSFSKLVTFISLSLIACVSQVSAAPKSCVAGTISIQGNGINTQLGSGFDNDGIYNKAGLGGGPLQVNLCDNTGAITILQTTNGPSQFPFLGIAQGLADPSSDITAGTATYGFVVASQFTNLGQHPGTLDNEYDSFQSSASGGAFGGLFAQSDIWVVDPVTSIVTAKWVNTDGSVPSLVFFQDSSDGGQIINYGVTADIAAVTASFASDGDVVTEVTFKFVPS
ncbi:hypothetical protein ABKN59_007317 [Abortiporus biennis]